MKRREFMKAGMGTMVVTGLGTTTKEEPVVAAAFTSAGQRIVLENDHYRLEVSAENGVIVRLVDKVSEVELLTEARLADNFRVLLPLPGLEANYLVGSEQKLTSFEKTADGLTLHWKGPLKPLSFRCLMISWARLSRRSSFLEMGPA